MDKISVVVPCYNKEDLVPIFYEEITKIVNKIKNRCEFEIVFVNDGSKDKTLEVIRKLNGKDKKVRYVSFTRNFGKEASILAGLDASSGDYVAIMNVYLNEQVSLVEEMYDVLKEGVYDCVATRVKSFKSEKKERFYHKRVKKILGDEECDLRLMSRQMVNSILELKEYNCFSKGIFNWLGYNIKWLEYKNVERVVKKNKLNFNRWFLNSLDKVMEFSIFPILPTLIFVFFLFLIVIIVILINMFFIENHVFNYFFLLSFLFIVGVVQIFYMGILGYYLSKIYLKLKRRPNYIIKETEVYSRNGSVLNERKNR